MLRRRQQGFTLVELLVSLTAGLLIALAVVAIAKGATNTFHEEIRVASAESSLRIAIDRVRADLQRASFMSTANIVQDPRIAKQPGDSNTTRIPAAYVGLRRLSGLRLIHGGSAAATPLSTNNTLLPDALEISGNFTTTDEFPIRTTDAPSGSCQRVHLQVDTPAMYRVRSIDGSLPNAPSAAVRTYFAGLFRPAPAGSTAQFVVRVADDTGHYQFAPLCNTADAVGFSGAGVPYVDLALNSLGVAVLSSAQTQTVGGQTGLGSLLSLNPVQTVRWELTATTSISSSNFSGLNPTNDPNKYDLVRTFVDANGNTVAGTTEVIAENAVDLKFAFSVDYAGASTGAGALLTAFPFDDTTSEATDRNAAAARDVSTVAAGATRPDRIRSVRVRLVTRTQSADRTADVAVAPANTGNERFLYRYCLDTTLANCSNGRRVWARARTMTMEVQLPNQQRFFW